MCLFVEFRCLILFCIRAVLFSMLGNTSVGCAIIGFATRLFVLLLGLTVCCVLLAGFEFDSLANWWCLLDALVSRGRSSALWCGGGGRGRRVATSLRQRGAKPGFSQGEWGGGGEGTEENLKRRVAVYQVGIFEFFIS